MKRIILVLLAIFIALSIWLALFPNSKGNISSLRKNSTAPNTSPHSNQNIMIDTPRKSDSVSSPLIIKGEVRVFENIISIRILAKSGKILAETTTYADSPKVGQFGKFQKDVTFYPTEKEGTLEIYQISAKDGSEIDKVIVPIIFK
jgi:hypothetical protein